MQSTGFDRIREYDRIVEAHKDEAVQVLRMPCMTPGGERILQGIYLCPAQPLDAGRGQAGVEVTRRAVRC